MKTKKIFFLLLSLSLLHLNLFSQKEKVTKEQHEEIADTTASKGFKESYNYLIRAQEEKLKLIKFPMELDKARIVFEKKIKPTWSYVIGGGVRFGTITTNFLQNTPANPPTGPSLFSDIGLRYYYNMNRRILKGKSANNFSANYFSFQSSNMIYLNNGYFYSDLAVLYGVQRRIGKLFYCDFNFGPNVNLNNGTTGLQGSVQFGIAF